MSGAESQGRNACPSLPERLPSGASPPGLLFLRLCGACPVPVGSAEERSPFLEATGVVVEPLRRQESKHTVANNKWGSYSRILKWVLDTGPAQLFRTLTQPIHFMHWNRRPGRGDGSSGAQSRSVTQLGPVPLSRG